MEAETQRTTDEVKHLKACLNDADQRCSASRYLERRRAIPDLLVLCSTALLGMLGLDFVYARLRDPVGGAPIEMVQVPSIPKSDGPAARHWSSASTPGWKTVRTRPLWWCESDRRRRRLDCACATGAS